MAPESAKISDTQEWFRKAKNGIQAAELLLSDKSPLIDEAAFHCQQSIEKSLKGFLFWNSRPFQKTHNLLALSSECLSIDSSLESLLKQTAPLTQYAVEYRYPGQENHPAKDEVEDMIDLAREILAAILQRVPKETHPD